jgi:hypothetical protein
MRNECLRALVGPARTWDPNSTARAPIIGSSTRALILTTVFATLAGASSAQAASEFDGIWVVSGVTRTGGCEPFRLSGQIVNGTAHSPGAAFRVAPSGAVTLTISVGPNHGVATGRLSKASGSGTWRAQWPNGSCSGSWTAQRR